MTLIGGNGNDYLSSGGVDKVSMVGGNGNDTIYNVTDINVQLSTNSTLIGGAGNDYIYNTGNDVTITGGTGNDTIRLGTALAGKRPYRYDVGGENILINYTAGDGYDLIQGFDSKATLSISGNTYSTKKSGDNLIVTVGKGKITLEGAASLEAPNITTDFLSVTNSTKSPVTVDATTKIIDATARTKAVKMTGNGLANVIIGGKGNDSLYGRAGNDSIVGNAGNDKLYGSNGNDTLVGGTGNDTLWGDAGADTFIYASGDGNDIILGFDDKDTLTLDNLDFAASYNKKYGTVTLAFDEGSVKLKNSTATAFHINDDTYKLSGSKFVKK